MAVASTSNTLTGGGWWDQNDESWKAQWWTCKLCQQWTWHSKTKCSRCGAKKSWCQGPPPEVPPTTAASESPFVTQSSPATDQSSVHIDTIRQLEQTLKSLPETVAFANVRASISAEVACCKKKITESKPLPSQLASCHAALVRAQVRKAKAEEKLQQAQKEVSECTKETTDLETKVRGLEDQIARAAVPPTKNSIDALASACEAVIGDMRNGNVGDGPVSEAMAKMQQLLTGVQTIAKQSSSNVAASTANRALKRTASGPPSGERGGENDPNAMRTDQSPSELPGGPLQSSDAGLTDSSAALSGGPND